MMIIKFFFVSEQTLQLKIHTKDVNNHLGSASDLNANETGCLETSGPIWDKNATNHQQSAASVLTTKS